MIKDVLENPDFVPYISLDKLIAMAEKDVSLYSNVLILGRFFVEKKDLEC